MSLHARFTAIVGALLLAVSPVHAQTPAPLAATTSETNATPQQAEATAFLAGMNISQSIDAWRRMLASPNAIANCACGGIQQERLSQAWIAAVNGAFDKPRMLTHMQAAVAERFSAREFADMAAQRASALGRKVAAAELTFLDESADETAAMARLSLAMERLAQDPERKALLDDITELSGGVESLADTLANLSIGLALGLEAAKPRSQPRAGLDEIVALVETHQAKVRQHLGPLVTAQYEMLYRDFDMAELDQVQQWLATATSRKSTQVLAEIFNAAMRDQALAIGARLAAELNAEQL